MSTDKNCIWIGILEPPCGRCCHNKYRMSRPFWHILIEAPGPAKEDHRKSKKRPLAVKHISIPGAVFAASLFLSISSRMPCGCSPMLADGPGFFLTAPEIQKETVDSGMFYEAVQMGIDGMHNKFWNKCDSPRLAYLSGEG